MSIRMPGTAARIPVIPFGELMLAARLASGLPQNHVARRLRVHATTVRGWERGRRQPHIDMIDAYLRVVGGTITLGAVK